MYGIDEIVTTAELDPKIQILTGEEYSSAIVNIFNQSHECSKHQA